MGFLACISEFSFLSQISGIAEKLLSVQARLPGVGGF